MRRLLLLVLLCSAYSHAAISFVNGASSSNSSQVSSCAVTIGSVPANGLVLFSVVTDSQVGFEPNSYGTPTATGLTFAPVTSVTTLSDAGSIQVFRAYTTGSLGSTTITSASWSHTHDEFCSADTFTGTAGSAANNGSDAIGNLCTFEQGSSVSTPSCTVTSSSHDNSKYFGVFDAPLASANAITAGTGYTGLATSVFNNTFVNAFRELSTNAVSPAGNTAVSASITTSNAPIMQAIELLAPATNTASLSPASFDFGSWTVGTSSTQQNFTFTNTGSGTITLSAVTLTGSDFMIDTSLCPASVSTSATCVVKATFEPGSTGAKSGTISFSGNYSGSPLIANLSGTGLAAPPSPTPPPPTPQAFNPFGVNVVISGRGAISGSVNQGPIPTTIPTPPANLPSTIPSQGSAPPPVLPPPPGTGLSYTTTLAAETSNNTSACNASGAKPAGCSNGTGYFTGMLDHCGQSDNGGAFLGSCAADGHSYTAPGPPTTPASSNIQQLYAVPPAGNVSKVNFKTMLYPGTPLSQITTKVVCHAQVWFGTSSHVRTTGQTSQTAALVTRQAQDMIDRGCDVMTINYYGQTGTPQEAVTALWTSELDSRCAGPQNCPLYLALMEDHGTKTGGTIGGFETDLNHAWSTFVTGHNSYWRVSTSGCSNRPVFLSFGWGESFDWASLKSWIHSSLNGSGVNCPSGEPLLASEGESGLSDPNRDGAYGWVGVNSYDNANPGSVTALGISGSGQFDPHFLGGSFGVDSWYSAAANSSAPVRIGAAFAHFNDTGADWGFSSSTTGQGRKVAGQCGAVWVNAWKRLTVNGKFSASNQIPFVGIPVWDDYEEGSAIEPGIENCYAAPSTTVAADSISWTLNPTDAVFSSINTVDHFTLYASDDGSRLAVIKDNIPVSTTSVTSLSALLPSGGWTLYLKQVGKPSVFNQMSSGASYTRP